MPNVLLSAALHFVLSVSLLFEVADDGNLFFSERKTTSQELAESFAVPWLWIPLFVKLRHVHLVVLQELVVLLHAWQNCGVVKVGSSKMPAVWKQFGSSLMLGKPCPAASSPIYFVSIHFCPSGFPASSNQSSFWGSTPLQDRYLFPFAFYCCIAQLWDPNVTCGYLANPSGKQLGIEFWRMASWNIEKKKSIEKYRKVTRLVTNQRNSPGFFWGPEFQLPPWYLSRITSKSWSFYFPPLDGKLHVRLKTLGHVMSHVMSWFWLILCVSNLFLLTNDQFPRFRPWASLLQAVQICT